MKTTRFFIAAIILVLIISGCAFTFVLPKPQQQMTEDSYKNKLKGFVVLSVLWKRYWGCGAFENAQLRSFGFDRMPLQTNADDKPDDLLIEGSRLYAEPRPVDYVLAVEPGEYALANYVVKIALSSSSVGYGGKTRSKLYHDDTVPPSISQTYKPIGGTFDVKAGEVVYIGHFGVDCYREPIIWRYYVEDRDGFEAFRKTIKAQYPYLDVNAMQYRLFKTSTFGSDYSLP
jgi:hypothetical protein